MLLLRTFVRMERDWRELAVWRFLSNCSTMWPPRGVNGWKVADSLLSVPSVTSPCYISLMQFSVGPCFLACDNILLYDEVRNFFISFFVNISTCWVGHAPHEQYWVGRFFSNYKHEWMICMESDADITVSPPDHCCWGRCRLRPSLIHVYIGFMVNLNLKIYERNSCSPRIALNQTSHTGRKCE